MKQKFTGNFFSIFGCSGNAQVPPLKGLESVPTDVTVWIMCSPGPKWIFDGLEPLVRHASCLTAGMDAVRPVVHVHVPVPARGGRKGMRNFTSQPVV